VMTAPYKINEKTREFYRDEVLISSLNPKNLKGIERKIFNCATVRHELIYLNPNYKGEDTPQNYRDWLELIYESIHNPESPKINTQNEGIKRVTEIVSYESISPEEWEKAKLEAARRKVIKLEREVERVENAINGIQKGYNNQIISDITGLTLEHIEEHELI
jgi:hypothetical protein